MDPVNFQWFSFPIKISLTSDAEVDGVALAGAVAVGGEAVVVARVGHRDALNDQAPVAHDHAAVLVVAQRNSLGLMVITHRGHT